MQRFNINADLYAAVIVAKRDVDWDEYMRKPKKTLKIDHTFYPPKVEDNELSKSIIQRSIIA